MRGCGAGSARKSSTALGAPTRKGRHGPPEAQAPGRVDEGQDLRLAPPLDGEIAGPGRDGAARVDAGIMRNQRLGFGDSRKVPPHAVRQRSDRARRDGRALVDALEVDGHRLVPSPFSPAQHEFPIAHRPRLLEQLIHVRAAVGARPLAQRRAARSSSLNLGNSLIFFKFEPPHHYGLVWDLPEPEARAVPDMIVLTFGNRTAFGLGD